MTVAFGEIALLDRKGGNDRRGAKQQIIGLEEVERALEHGAALRFRRGDLGTGEIQALLDIPDDFGFELVAMIFEQRLHAGCEGQRAQHLETLMCFAEIGMRLFDDDAFGLEPLRRLHNKIGDFRIDRRDAEIAAHRHAFRLRLPCAAAR